MSRKGQSVRFHADDATLRPMARATQGVIGMKFRGSDDLLAMDVVRDDAFVVTVTDGGFAKRTSVAEWTPKGRGILGVKAMRLANDERGSLVGAIVADEDDEIFAIKASGEVIRTPVGAHSGHRPRHDGRHFDLGRRGRRCRRRHPQRRGRSTIDDA